MGIYSPSLHTEYSLLDEVQRIKDVVAKARELGMTSLAISDHGVMSVSLTFTENVSKRNKNR